MARRHGPALLRSPLMRRTMLAVFATLGLTALAAGCADGETVVTVRHGEIPGVTYLDLGDTGASAGDERIFDFDATDSHGGTVGTHWVMITTAVDGATGAETRSVRGTFTFNADDQLILDGVADYPKAGATLEKDVTVIRAVVGGTGRYAGARGWVKTIHHVDGTWTHEFHLK